MKLNWPEQADLLFDQMETLITERLHAAEYCMRSEAIITNDEEYRGKVEAFRDTLTDLSVMRRVWIST